MIDDPDHLAAELKRLGASLVDSWEAQPGDISVRRFTSGRMPSGWTMLSKTGGTIVAYQTITSNTFADEEAIVLRRAAPALNG